MSECPVCKQDFYAVNQSLDVCEKHSVWNVGQCKACHRICFYEKDHLCPECWGILEEPLSEIVRYYDLLPRSQCHFGFSHDPRAVLVAYGFEIPE